MKALYFDLSMGAAGDMLSGALLNTLENPQEFVDYFNSLGIPHVHMSFDYGEKLGVRGLHVKMLVHGRQEQDFPETGEPEHHSLHTHAHRTLEDVSAIIASLPLTAQVKTDAQAVYELIAGAESVVHGEAVTKVHFHEVGALDAIADVLCFSMLIRKIAPERVFSSPVHVGSGTVRCAHGILPVPAPATARLLEGIPSYGGEIDSELCTPTGAALLRYYVSEFGNKPQMSVSSVGIGLGSKDFPRPNCVRVEIGEI